MMKPQERIKPDNLIRIIKKAGNEEIVDSFDIDYYELIKNNGSAVSSETEQEIVSPLAFIPKQRGINPLIRVAQDLKIPIKNFKKLEKSSNFITLPHGIHYDFYYRYHY